jgi:hypothetical protein
MRFTQFKVEVASVRILNILIDELLRYALDSQERERIVMYSKRDLLRKQDNFMSEARQSQDNRSQGGGYYGFGAKSASVDDASLVSF